MAKVLTPAMRLNCGCSSRAMSSVERRRSDQSTARYITLPCDTVGLPTLAKMRSNSG
jgi:hypothetical protein